LSGAIVVLDAHHPTNYLEMQPFDCKLQAVFLTQQVATNEWYMLLLSVKNDLYMYSIQLGQDSIHVGGPTHIVLPPHTQPSSVCLCQENRLLIVGSREGALLVYPLDTTPVLHVWQARRTHDKNAVTSVVAVEKQDSITVWTCGRDGKYCQWKLQPSTGYEMHCSHRSRVTKGWLEKVSPSCTCERCRFS
jgi:hypothetical protein